MFTIVIPRENHHTRLYTAYRACQIYFGLISKGEACELVDLNCEEENYLPTNKLLVFPIEWSATFISKNFQNYIDIVSNYNDVIITGRYVDFYQGYARRKYNKCTIQSENELIIWHDMLKDPLFLKNKHGYA